MFQKNRHPLTSNKIRTYVPRSAIQEGGGGGHGNQAGPRGWPATIQRGLRRRRRQRRLAAGAAEEVTEEEEEKEAEEDEGGKEGGAEG